MRKDLENEENILRNKNLLGGTRNILRILRNKQNVRNMIQKREMRIRNIIHKEEEN